MVFLLEIFPRTALENDTLATFYTLRSTEVIINNQEKAVV